MHVGWKAEDLSRFMVSVIVKATVKVSVILSNPCFLFDFIITRRYTAAAGTPSPGSYSQCGYLSRRKPFEGMHDLRGSDAQDDDWQFQTFREVVDVKRVVNCAEDTAPANDEGLESVHLLPTGLAGRRDVACFEGDEARKG